MDFAWFRFDWGVRYAQQVVLGSSRLLSCRFYPLQDMATLIDGLEDAFLHFGGVPQELLFDQMKAVITRDVRLEGGALVRNAEFLRFAHHWGFTPRACRPYRAQPKGKVERPVRDLRGNVVYGRTFLHDADLDQQRQLWLDRVANVRLHDTTGERPRLRVDREERFLLQPLAARRYTSLIIERPSHVTPARQTPRPVVVVEKRSLRWSSSCGISTSRFSRRCVASRSRVSTSSASWSAASISFSARRRKV